ncbi:Hypothetical predicted protein, partial [Mytilus galloprovincialis]
LFSSLGDNTTLPGKARHRDKEHRGKHFQRMYKYKKYYIATCPNLDFSWSVYGEPQVVWERLIHIIRTYNELSPFELICFNLTFCFNLLKSKTCYQMKGKDIIDLISNYHHSEHGEE